MLNIKNSGKHAHTLSNKKNQSNTPFHSQIHPTNVNTWPTRLLRDHVTHSYYEWMDNWINECMTEKMMWWNIRKRNKNTTSCDRLVNILHEFIFLWCRCSCETCVIMPTARECKCCHFYAAIEPRLKETEVNCITNHEGFIANCLNRWVLETSFYEYLQENGPLEENERVHKYVYCM